MSRKEIRCTKAFDGLFGNTKGSLAHETFPNPPASEASREVANGFD